MPSSFSFTFPTWSENFPNVGKILLNCPSIIVDTCSQLEGNRRITVTFVANFLFLVYLKNVLSTSIGEERILSNFANCRLSRAQWWRLEGNLKSRCLCYFYKFLCHLQVGGVGVGKKKANLKIFEKYFFLFPIEIACF